MKEKDITAWYKNTQQAQAELKEIKAIELVVSLELEEEQNDTKRTY